LVFSQNQTAMGALVDIYAVDLSHGDQYPDGSDTQDLSTTEPKSEPRTSRGAGRKDPCPIRRQDKRQWT
jgi:hypothetical protein